MKITCPRKFIVSAFRVVKPVINARSPNSAMTHAKLSVNKNKATLCGTSADTSVSVEIPLENNKSLGEVLMPCELCGTILGAMTGDEVEIASSESGVVISDAWSKFEIQSEDVANFPQIPSFSSDSYLVASAGAVKDAFSKAAVATSKEGSRSFRFDAVVLVRSEDGFEFAATDSRRLAVRRVEFASVGSPTLDAKMLIHASSVAKLQAILSQADDDEEVRVAMQDGVVLFQFGDIVFSTRLMSGAFPNYHKVIPQDGTIVAEVVAGELLRASRQVEATTSEESAAALFSFSDERLELSSRASGVGESRVVVNLESYAGSSILVRMLPRFVSDFLKTVDADEIVTMRIKDERTAVLFTAGEKTKYVVMPIA
jgi:DNA polymerase-3 subunit beta